MPLAQAWAVEHASDWLISIAYFSIPVQLLYFLFKFPISLDRQHKSVISLFASFILLCGLTHAFHALHMLLKWRDGHEPVSAAVSTTPEESGPIHAIGRILLWTKISCAIISLITCVFLYCIIPKLLTHIRYVGELEESMKKRLIELDEAKDTAENANARKGEFMSFLCHEIRNPLLVITANVDFLLETANAANQGSQVDESDLHAQMALERESTTATDNSIQAEFDAPPRGCSDANYTSSNGTPATEARSLTPHSTGSSARNSAIAPFQTPPSHLFNIPSVPPSPLHHNRTGSNLVRGCSGDPTGLPPPHDGSPARTTRHVTPVTPGKMLTPLTANGGGQSYATGIAAALRAACQCTHNSTAPAALSLEQRQYLKSINHAAELMVSICNDVLDIAKLESGVIVFEHVAVDLPLLCESFIGLCRPQAAAKNILISLVWNPPALPSRYVFCDPTRLHQVFLQIVSNAIKFSNGEEGGKDAVAEEEEQQAVDEMGAATGFPPRLGSGAGSGGQIQFRVRSYTPSAAELAVVYPAEVELISPRLQELEQSARASTSGTLAEKESRPLYSRAHSATPHFVDGHDAASHRRGRHSRSHSGVLLINPSCLTAQNSSSSLLRSSPQPATTGVSFSPPRSGGGGGGGGGGGRRSGQPAFSLANVLGYSPLRGAITPGAPSTYPSYGARTEDSGSSQNTDDGGDEDTLDERHQLISGTTGTGSCSSSHHSSSPLMPQPSPPQHHTPFAYPDHPAPPATGGDTVILVSPSPPLVHVAIEEVSVAPRPEYAWIEFVVADNGCGISAAGLEHIFTPYSESKLTTYRPRGGTGLGLSICKEVVTQLGGDLVATSIEGKGSIFTMRMRFQIARPEDVLETSAPQEAIVVPPPPLKSTPLTRSSSLVGVVTPDEPTDTGARYGFGNSQPNVQSLQTQSHPPSHAPSPLQVVSTLPPPQPQQQQQQGAGPSASSVIPPSLVTFPPVSAAASAAAIATPFTPVLPTIVSDGSITKQSWPPSGVVPYASPASSSSTSAGQTPILLDLASVLPTRSDSISSAASSPFFSSTSPLTGVSPANYPGALSMTTMMPILTPPTASPTKTATHRLLVVDDNEINRKLLSRMMSSLAYEVDTAEDGVFAVEAVKNNMLMYRPPAAAADSDSILPEEEQRRQAEYERNRYSCIIMDLSMPNMNGYEATIEIRAMGFMAPVIALTANALTEERSKAFEAGCNEFCTKPIRKHELVALMKHFCGHDHLAGTTAAPTPGPPPPGRQKSITSPAGSTLLPPAPSGVASTQPYASSASSSTANSSTPSPTTPHSPMTRRLSSGTLRAGGRISGEQQFQFSTGVRPRLSGTSGPMGLLPASDPSHQRSVSARDGQQSGSLSAAVSSGMGSLTVGSPLASPPLVSPTFSPMILMPPMGGRMNMAATMRRSILAASYPPRRVDPTDSLVPEVGDDSQEARDSALLSSPIDPQRTASLRSLIAADTVLPLFPAHSSSASRPPRGALSVNNSEGDDLLSLLARQRTTTEMTSIAESQSTTPADSTTSETSTLTATPAAAGTPSCGVTPSSAPSSSQPDSVHTGGREAS